MYVVEYIIDKHTLLQSYNNTPYRRCQVVIANYNKLC